MKKNDLRTIFTCIVLLLCLIFIAVTSAKETKDYEYISNLYEEKKEECKELTNRVLKLE